MSAIGQHACVEKLPAALVGAAVSIGTWLTLLPWDLSEIDAHGQIRDQGGDDYGVVIAVVAIVVMAIAVGLVSASRTRRWAVPFVVGGLATWAVLFAWRAGVSETSGANMFMIPLLFAVIPLTIAGPLLLRRLTFRLEDRS